MDGYLGALHSVTPDCQLSQGNSCSRGSEPVVHVFLVALCKLPLVFDIE
jgi:hypothetical protein